MPTFKRAVPFLFLSSLAIACTQSPVSEESSDDDILETAEALSAESGSSDPVEEANLTDEDAIEASNEAVEAQSAPDPQDVGCGVRKGLRIRIKEHFDKNDDGKLDADERRDLKDAIDGHPRMKLALVRLGIQPRRHVWKRIKGAYDADNDGELDAAERKALAAAVEARCEARKERILGKFDKDADGKLDDGELRDAIKAGIQLRVARLKELFGKVDTNDDGRIDDAEREAAREALKVHYLAKRAEVKDKFDTNDDGKLDDAEIAALKAAIRERFEKEAPAE